MEGRTELEHHSADELDNIIKSRQILESWIEAPEYPSSMAIPAMHKTLLEGIEAYSKKGITPSLPGRYRNVDLLVDWENTNLYARGLDVEPLMSQFCRTLDSKIENLPKQVSGNLDKIIHEASWAYYVFIRIHPFNDGNGRTGRNIINKVIMGVGLPEMIFLRDWFNEERDIHLDIMMAVTSTGDLTYLELYLLNLLKMQVRNDSLIEEINKLIEIKRHKEHPEQILTDIWEGFGGIDIFGNPEFTQNEQNLAA